MGRKPKKQDEPPPQCVICTEPITKDMHTLPCKHSFHNACVEQLMDHCIIQVGKDAQRSGFFISDGYAHGIDTVISMYDSGDFSCPLCNKSYTMLHADDLTNMMFASSYKYRPYNIKIKYCQDDVSMKNMWFSQYVENMEEFIKFNGIIDDVHDRMTQFMYRLNSLYADEMAKGNKMVFHALYCDCEDEQCGEYMYALETVCPLCTFTGVTAPPHIKHASVNQIKKCINRRYKKIIKTTIGKIHHMHQGITLRYGNDDSDMEEDTRFSVEGG